MRKKEKYKREGFESDRGPSLVLIRDLPRDWKCLDKIPRPWTGKTPKTSTRLPENFQVVACLEISAPAIEQPDWLILGHWTSEVTESCNNFPYTSPPNKWKLLMRNGFLNNTQLKLFMLIYFPFSTTLNICSYLNSLAKRTTKQSLFSHRLSKRQCATREFWKPRFFRPTNRNYFAF